MVPRHVTEHPLLYSAQSLVLKFVHSNMTRFVRCEIMEFDAFEHHVLLPINEPMEMVVLHAAIQMSIITIQVEGVE